MRRDSMAHALVGSNRGACNAARIILAATLAIAAFALVDGMRTSAQVPPTEEQARAVEQQLLCPVCTNERLDVCSTAICRDMKQIIRERLAAGSTPDDIILYFEQRYGPKVRAELEPKGFNLWLYGWIGGSVLLVGALGTWFLVGLRRRARPVVATANGSPGHSSTGGPPEDDAWLDAQIAEGDDRPH